MKYIIGSHPLHRFLLSFLFNRRHLQIASPFSSALPISAAAYTSPVASTPTCPCCCLQVAGRLDPVASALQPAPRRSRRPRRVRAAACKSPVASTPSPPHYCLHIACCLDPSAPELPLAYRHSPTRFRCTVRWLVSSFLCFVVILGPSCTQNSGVAILQEGDHDNTVVQCYGILREIDELQIWFYTYANLNL